MIVSYGTRGARKRERGCPWESVTRLEAPREVLWWMRGTEGAVVRGAYPIRRMPEVREAYRQVSAEYLDDDVIRVWCDVYYRRLDDPVHGIMRVSGELVSEDAVAVTRWFRPYGHGWEPMFGTPRSPLWVELGWLMDFDDDMDDTDARGYRTTLR